MRPLVVCCCCSGRRWEKGVMLQMSKKKAIVGVLAGTLALVLAAGVAWAATVQCQMGAERCLGTSDADTITGTSGVDYIRALGGNDLARGMGAGDVVQGGKGKDTVK